MFLCTVWRRTLSLLILMELSTLLCTHCGDIQLLYQCLERSQLFSLGWPEVQVHVHCILQIYNKKHFNWVHNFVTNTTYMTLNFVLYNVL